MQTLPLARLAALLTANAKGYYATEAATRLLIGHETWLHRTDFLASCVETWDAEYSVGAATWPDHLDLDPDTITGAAVNWGHIPGFVAEAACSGSEGRVLRLVAELAGYDTATPLDELLSGLDDRNSRLVVDAIAHALHLPAPYPEAGQ